MIEDIISDIFMLHHEIYLCRRINMCLWSKAQARLIAIWSNAPIDRSIYKNVELNKLTFKHKRADKWFQDFLPV